MIKQRNLRGTPPTPQQLTRGTHCDIGERRPHHEAVHPGLQLQDLGRGEDDPGGGQDEEEDGGQERQEGFVQAAVLQSVAPVSPETSARPRRLHVVARQPQNSKVSFQSTK